jgi:hypothetical protein
MRNVAPLRKVVSREMQQVATSLSQRGRHLVIKYEYDVIYKLECGHGFRVRIARDRQTESKRCQQCHEVQS